MPPAGMRDNNNAAFSSRMNNNNAGEAMYFGEYRQSQGCFNGCGMGNNNNNGNFIPPYQLRNMPTTTTTSLSQAKDELKQTEEFLASEFNKLSFQERAKALEDIHCVAPEASALKTLAATAAAQPPNNNKSLLLPSTDLPWPRHPLHSNHLNHPELEPLPPEEQDPFALQKLFDEFQVLIQKEHNPFYEMATLQNPNYLRDPILKLMFLRANFYKVGASVKQLLAFLKYKAEYFGTETLGREITMDDMTEEDKRMMKSGLFHIQGKRDKSGRVITILMNHQFGQFDTSTIIRVAYYMWFNIIIRMPGVQTKGLTAITYDSVPPGEELVALPSIGFLIPLLGFSDSLPYRYSSMHFCLKNTNTTTDGGASALRLSLNNSALAVLTKGFPQYSRVRSKIHYGSDMELLYQLQAYGIDLVTFPIDVKSGKVKSDEILNKWYYDYHNNNNNNNNKTTTKVDTTSSHSTVDGNVSKIGRHNFDDLDLDKTFIDDDYYLETNNNTTDWDIDDLFHNNNEEDGSNNANVQGDDSNRIAVRGHHNKGGGSWFESLAFGFGASSSDGGATTDSGAPSVLLLETPKRTIGDGLTASLSGNPASAAAGGQAPRLAPAYTARASGAVPLTNKRNGGGASVIVVVEPTLDDILLGRGKNVQYHPGNVNFRKWMEEYRDEYERTPRHKKTRIASEMISILSSNGIRFLKQQQQKQKQGGQGNNNKNSKGWVVADSKEAEEKIKQLFRSRRKKLRE